MGRDRNHLRCAVTLKRGNLNASDLHLATARADQHRGARSALDASAGVQKQPTSADFLPQFAIAIRGHGVGAILRIADENGLGTARRELAAKPQRFDRRRQPLGHGQDRPVRVGGLLIAQRIEPRAELVMRDPRMSGVTACSIAYEEMHRIRTDENARSGG